MKNKLIHIGCEIKESAIDKHFVFSYQNIIFMITQMGSDAKSSWILCRLQANDSMRQIKITNEQGVINYLNTI